MSEPSAPFTVSGAFVDISPSQHLPLAGYLTRRVPQRVPQLPIEGQVLIVGSKDRRIVLISIDLLYAGDRLRTCIECELNGLFAPEDIFIAATHTHFAPGTDEKLSRLGEVSETFVAEVAKKLATLAVSLANQKGRSANLLYSTGFADHAIFRRLAVPWWRSLFRSRWQMRPDPSTPIDEGIHLLKLTDESGIPVALCWSYACHPVCYPDKCEVHPDFPGIVRSALRAKYGPIPILFFQGFSGDVRPRAIRKSSGGLLRHFSLPAFVPFSWDEWSVWSKSLSQVVLAITEGPSKAILGPLSTKRWRVPTGDLGIITAQEDVSIHVISIGQDLALFGISAEPVTAHSRYLSQLYGSRKMIPVSCIDAVFGYLPSDEMIAQGGYEARGFMRLFGATGRFRADLSKIVKKRLFVQPRE